MSCIVVPFHGDSTEAFSFHVQGEVIILLECIGEVVEVLNVSVMDEEVINY